MSEVEVFVPQEPYPLFTSTSKDLIHKDAMYWLGTLQGLIEQYRCTRVDVDRGKYLRACICAKIAGFAIALSEHFGAGVNELIDGEGEVDHAVTLTEAKFSSGQKHSICMNKEAKDNLS